jgi:hypothetical protein
MLLRLVLAVCFALAIAWLLGRHFKIPIFGSVATRSLDKKITSRFVRAIKQGYQHQLDHTAPWVMLGWAIAVMLSAESVWAFFEQALWLQVLVMVKIFRLTARPPSPAQTD